MALYRTMLGGIDYYFYQSDVEIKNIESPRKIVVRTEVGTMGKDSNEFNQRRWTALAEHGKKIDKIWRESTISRYHFENVPEFHNIDKVMDLEYRYHVIRGKLSQNELQDFEQVLFIRYVYGTTSLEGNRYSELETSELLNSNIVSATKSPTEATEIRNYNEVRKFVKSYKGRISEDFVKHVHSILMKDIRKSDGSYVNAGQYRTEHTKIKNSWYVPAAPEIIGTRMKYLIDDFYSTVEKSIHPVESSSLFHQRFEEIHPFEDGNGRTGREILNHMLRRSRFPQIYIPPIEHELYFFCLEEGNKPNYVPLIDFIIHRMYQSMMYFMTQTGLNDSNYSDEFRGFFETTSGKEEYKRYIELSEKFRSAESLD